MKERAFFISSWQYKICRQILREQELRDKKKGSLTTSTILLTLNLNLYEKNVLQRLYNTRCY